MNKWNKCYNDYLAWLISIQLDANPNRVFMGMTVVDDSGSN